MEFQQSKGARARGRPRKIHLCKSDKITDEDNQNHSNDNIKIKRSVGRPPKRRKSLDLIRHRNNKKNTDEHQHRPTTTTTSDNTVPVNKNPNQEDEEINNIVDTDDIWWYICLICHRAFETDLNFRYHVKWSQTSCRRAKNGLIINQTNLLPSVKLYRCASRSFSSSSSRNRSSSTSSSSSWIDNSMIPRPIILKIDKESASAALAPEPTLLEESSSSPVSDFHDDDYNRLEDSVIEHDELEMEQRAQISAGSNGSAGCGTTDTDINHDQDIPSSSSLLNYFEQQNNNNMVLIIHSCDNQLKHIKNERRPSNNSTDANADVEIFSRQNQFLVLQESNDEVMITVTDRDESDSTAGTNPDPDESESPASFQVSGSGSLEDEERDRSTTTIMIVDDPDTKLDLDFSSSLPNNKDSPSGGKHNSSRLKSKVRRRKRKKGGKWHRPKICLNKMKNNTKQSSKPKKPRKSKLKIEAPSPELQPPSPPPAEEEEIVINLITPTRFRTRHPQQSTNPNPNDTPKAAKLKEIRLQLEEQQICNFNKPKPKYRTCLFCPCKFLTHLDLKRHSKKQQIAWRLSQRFLKCIKTEEELEAQAPEISETPEENPPGESDVDADDTADELPKSSEDETFKCILCKKKTFSTLAELNTHACTAHLFPHPSRHLGTYPSCFECGKKCMSINALRCHRSVHLKKLLLSEEEQTPVQCPHCPVQITSIRHLPAHIYNVHTTHDDQWNCHICGRPCISKNKLDTHVVTHNARAPDHPEYVGHKCSICSSSFATPRYLQKHVQYVHRQISSNLVPDSAESQSYKCTKCTKVFSTQIKFSRHIKLCLDPKTHKCPHCPNVYKSKQPLRAHIQIAHAGLPQQHICPICSKGFELGVTLKAHIRYIHAEKSWECQETGCGKKYKTSQKLKTHTMIAHPTGDDATNPKYQCETCGKKFMTSTYLYQHRLSHTDESEKRHVCDVCGKKFGLPAHLRQHLKTHDKD